MKPRLPMVLTIATAALFATGLNVQAGVSSPPKPGAMPMVQTVADQEMTVSNSYGYANLRQKPSTSSKLLARLLQGTKVVFIEKVSGGTWVHVKAGAKDGYIKADLLK